MKKPIFSKYFNKTFLFTLVQLFTAIVFYLVVHGTKNLEIVRKLNSIRYIIPVFNGLKCKNIFITGYLVDILYYNSICTYLTTYKKWYYFFLSFVFVSFFEILQLNFSNLGTFDYIDLCIYFIISVIYSFIYLFNR